MVENEGAKPIACCRFSMKSVSLLCTSAKNNTRKMGTPKKVGMEDLARGLRVDGLGTLIGGILMVEQIFTPQCRTKIPPEQYVPGRRMRRNMKKKMRPNEVEKKKKREDIPFAPPISEDKNSRFVQSMRA